MADPETRPSRPRPSMLMALATLRRDGYLPRTALAQELALNKGRPIPLEIERYTADVLLGKIKDRKGRPAVNADERDQLIAWLYHRLMGRLKRAQRAKAPKSQRGRANKADAATAERVANRVAGFINDSAYYKQNPVSARAVQNIASRVSAQARSDTGRNGFYQPFWREVSLQLEKAFRDVNHR